jgi:hypothetical protein
MIEQPSTAERGEAEQDLESDDPVHPRLLAASKKKPSRKRMLGFVKGYDNC